MASIQEVKGVDQSCTDRVMNGLVNCSGTLLRVAHSQGILRYVNTTNGQSESVLFEGSKLWLSGTPVSAETVLSTLPGLEEGCSLMFDAVPCDTTDPNGCSWHATAVWKGVKPTMEYDNPVLFDTNTSSASLFQLSVINLLTSNPLSQFLRTEGQVLKIIGPEYGLALASIKNNHWESVLFHRSKVSLFGMNLATADLTDIFQEGDQLRIVAAAAPKNMGVQWVASEIKVFVGPSIAPTIAQKFGL